MNRFIVVTLFAAIPAVSAAQSPAPKPDSAKPAAMDHMSGPWKEMNDFHRVMGATWHPASSKNDMAPLKARVKDLVTAAEAWATSKPPAHPPSCASAEVRAAAAKVAKEAKALATLVESGADDSKLKEALKGVHDNFEVAEHACGGHG